MKPYPFAAFPFINTKCIDGLELGLPEYLAAAEDISDQIDIMELWKAQEDNDAMPHWTRICKLVLSSLASAKGVFSISNNSFNSQQESSLEDYILLSLMVQ